MGQRSPSEKDVRLGSSRPSTAHTNEGSTCTSFLIKANATLAVRGSSVLNNSFVSYFNALEAAETTVSNSWTIATTVSPVKAVPT